MARLERDAKDAVRSGSVLLSGGYAWASTVLLPASERMASLSCRVTAGLAAGVLVTGCWVSPRRLALGRGLALHAFVGLCVLTWVLSTAQISVDRLDPIRSAFGALAWLLFALSWGIPREPKRVPEDDPGVLAGDPFPPREAPGVRSNLALSVAVAGSALPLAAAFTVDKKDHALLAHALAVGLAVAILTSGARVATARSPRARRRGGDRARLSAALVPLVLVLLLLVAGVVSKAFAP